MQKRGRPIEAIELGNDERRCLENLVVSCDNGKMRRRAEVILLSATKLDSSEVARKVDLSEQSVCKWRQRYLSDGINGLQDKPRLGRACKPIVIAEDDREVLESWRGSRSLPQGLVNRSRIILFAAESRSNLEIASLIGMSSTTVRKWKKRFRDNGLEGLHDEFRKGRPRTFEDEKIACLLTKTLQSKPEGATHWSCRSMAEETGISPSTVNRIWNLFSLKPHKRRHFKLSTDPFFVDKVIDVCGIYLNPPDDALVLCVDEKSQCQALERTQPILPMDFGYAEGVTENYYRHGVTTLFSAWNVATGEVQIACKKRHRHQEFISFLNQIRRNVPSELDVHVILDNYSTHKHEKVKAWIARNPRFQFHFIPTYSSWLNQVERWFAMITDKAIRRGSFTSVKQLVEQIEKFTEVHNRKPKPFTWTATPEQIFAKLGRLCDRINPED